MLAQRLRRWPNIQPILVQRLMFAEKSASLKMVFHLVLTKQLNNGLRFADLVTWPAESLFNWSAVDHDSWHGIIKLR